MVVGSPLNIEFNAALTMFKFYPSNVLVTVFDENKVPMAGWLFTKAFPVRWATSTLDAGRNEVAIDTMELAYARMPMIRI
jgi:phage tail-like protein